MNKKRVLITGAGRGIGKAIADLLGSIEFYEILTPTREEMDLKNQDSIKEYFSKNNKVDVLINNAGVNILGEIDNISDGEIDDMININLSSPLKIVREVVPHMKEHNFGRIVNISSIWGVRSKEFRTLYSATKFGINGVTKSLARELGRYNILVNSICPGYVNTELTQKNVTQEQQEKIKIDIPLGRFAEPREIANLVKFLISDENSYITGQIIIIDGGYLA